MLSLQWVLFPVCRGLPREDFSVRASRYATYKEHCSMMNSVCLKAMMSSMVMTLTAFPRTLAALPKSSEVAPFSITTSSLVGLETTTFILVSSSRRAVAP